MEESRRERPWWRKKRWAAALLLWAGAAYSAMAGPAVYAVARAWLPSAFHEVAYTPLWAVIEDTAAEEPVRRYEAWFAAARRLVRLTPRRPGRILPPSPGGPK